MASTDIIILDFGSQTTHLIARRIKEAGVSVKILPPDTSLDQLLTENPRGFILSGGPASVYNKRAPQCNPQIFQSGIPILGICYGLQLLTYLLEGRVEKGLKKEYGPANLQIASGKWQIADGLPENMHVWMSHGDKVVKLPKDFEIIGSTKHSPFTFVGDEQRKIYGVQFHPEVSHTPQGDMIFKNFVFNICHCQKKKKKTISIKNLVLDINNQIGGKKAICALSGGIDSAVAAVLVNRTIGKNLICFYVDTGLMRQSETEQIITTFKKYFHLNLKIIKAEKIFLQKLKGLSDPEKKRKIIGETFIRIFENEAQKLGKVSFLVQGTIYPDIIESQGTPGADKIKSHHNVGGLPKKHGFKLIEPLRSFYKDEVRILAQKLGFPKDLIWRQPFPGPGLAIRIMGEVTAQKLKILKSADLIVCQEIEKAGLVQKLWMFFAILTGVRTTAVMGDARAYGETIALRIIESKDAMTANFARLPYPFLEKISARIINEVPGVSRIVYDITTKPPATMEWE
ncbi:glutamine-hydrolyzing GMP synthase [Candidatus Microgenomates bacterium]|nr:glutamine-hydrolyzing GMP synthase [Candidatus Microgenomates bacterium]